MLKARYYQNDGSEGKAQALPEWLFDGVVHEDVLHQVIKAYLSNQRQGTAAAKSRGPQAVEAEGDWAGPSRNDSRRAIYGGRRRVSAHSAFVEGARP